MLRNRFLSGVARHVKRRLITLGWFSAPLPTASFPASCFQWGLRFLSKAFTFCFHFSFPYNMPRLFMVVILALPYKLEIHLSISAQFISVYLRNLSSHFEYFVKELRFNNGDYLCSPCVDSQRLAIVITTLKPQ
ncbi:hypothetical protein MG293_009922 [Ovis ammon polii]|uniref:Uncharacterized protein n=1 Tax=Ovis ammon polii TaxID=230172 RepID=A0AAD4U779_OVIAM|nr:hypothetical protein MG293_009922 [Ovis ammon polii]